MSKVETPAAAPVSRRLPPGEGARKAVHLAMAGFALLLRWLSWPIAALCAIGAFAFNLVLLPRLAGHRLASGREDAGDTGVLVYPLVVLALILLFHRPGSAPGDLGLAAFGWGLLAGGDGIAGIAGMKWGRHPLPWNVRKTWEGFAGYLVGGGVFGTALLVWCTPGLARLEAHATGFWVTHLGAAAGAVMAAAIVESVPHGLDDNVLPPLFGTLLLAAGTRGVAPAMLLPTGVLHTLLIAAGVNAGIAALAFAVSLLEPAGIAAAWVLGVTTWGFGTWKAYVLLWIFLGAGTAVTRFHRRDKRNRGLEDEARRGLSHVLANGALCFIGSILVWLTGGSPLAAGIVAASLAAALADTAASEIGKALGRRAYALPSLRAVPPGTEGAVSIPGTLAGLAGAVLIAWPAIALGFLPAAWFLPLVLGGCAAMLIEGLLPALGPGTNAGTNLANTIIGVLLAVAIRSILP